MTDLDNAVQAADNLIELGKAKMARQHFELIAEVLANTFTPDGGNWAPMDTLIESFADTLGATNPNFDRNRFISAATGKELKR